MGSCSLEVVSVYCGVLVSRAVKSGSHPSPKQGGRQRPQKEKGDGGERGHSATVCDGTYCIEGALPVVGDVGLAFRRFLEDPFVTFIRGHLSHQPAKERRG